MRYSEYRDAIRAELRRRPEGRTWKELQRRLNLPYKTPCATWTRMLEAEIGLLRTQKDGRALVWKIIRDRLKSVPRSTS